MIITVERDDALPCGCTHRKVLPTVRPEYIQALPMPPPAQPARSKTMTSEQPQAPIPIRLQCPECGTLHIDEGEFATKPHHTHACQHCGNVWRPAVVHTLGVRFLPGFKNGGQGT